MFGVKIGQNASDQMVSNSNLRCLHYLKYAKIRPLFLGVNFRSEATN